MTARHRTLRARIGRGAPPTQLLHEGSPARGADPDPPQPKHVVRWRRTLSSLVSRRAADRRRVNHFQPFPLHRPHARGTGSLPHVMTLMIRVVTLRRCTVTVPSHPWLSHQCGISVTTVR
jgi:hypothetical protein